MLGIQVSDVCLNVFWGVGGRGFMGILCLGTLAVCVCCAGLSEQLGGSAEHEMRVDVQETGIKMSQDQGYVWSSRSVRGGPQEC